MNKTFRMWSDFRLLEESGFVSGTEYFNVFLEREYGIKYYKFGVYEIVDESKFMMFMLKHPHQIKNLSYE